MPLWVLWGAWAILLLGGFLYGLITRDFDARQHIPTVGRMGSSFTLVLAGVAWWYFLRQGAASSFAALIAVGMTLGFIGDLFNAGFLPGIFPEDLMGGIVSFGLGHIAYIAGCMMFMKAAHWKRTPTFWTAVGVWQLFALVGWWFIVMNGQEPTVLHWAALPYSMLLAGTAGVCSGLALIDKRFSPLALGGALFLISDLLLAFEQFRGSLGYAGDLVWLTYGPAQMLIVFSCFSADRILYAPETQAAS